MRTLYMLSAIVSGARGFVLSHIASPFRDSQPIGTVQRGSGAAAAVAATLPPTRLAPFGWSAALAPTPSLARQRRLCRSGKAFPTRKHRRRRRHEVSPRLCAASAGDGEGQSKKPVLILGAGWVGSRLAQSLVESGSDVFVTNRPGTDMQSKPPYFRPVEVACPPANRIGFDLGEEATWEALPPPESIGAVIVTFSLNKTPELFWDRYLSRVGGGSAPILVYSTTSVYRVDLPGQDVDEDTPLRDEVPRATAETFLQERGATVLTIAGIFGDQRTPRAICTCLSTYTSAGGALNGRKQLNMVHVDDIIAASKACLATPQPCTRINVAGNTLYLSQLISHCKHPPIPDGPDTDSSSKSVSSQKLLTEVMPSGYAFREALGETVPLN